MPADRDCPGAGFDRQRGAPAIDCCAERDRTAVLGRIERGGGGVGDRPGVSLIVRGVDRRTGELDRPGGDRQRVQRGRGGADIAQDRRAGAGGDSQILRPAHRGQADFCTGRARIERGRAGEGEAGKRGILAKRQRALRRGRAKAVGRAALHLVGAGIEREAAVGQREVCGAGDAIQHRAAAARIDRQQMRSAGDLADADRAVAGAGQRGIGAKRNGPGQSLCARGGNTPAVDRRSAIDLQAGELGDAAHRPGEGGEAIARLHFGRLRAIECLFESDRAVVRARIEQHAAAKRDRALEILRAGGCHEGAVNLRLAVDGQRLERGAVTQRIAKSGERAAAVDGQILRAVDLAKSQCFACHARIELGGAGQGQCAKGCRVAQFQRAADRGGAKRGWPGADGVVAAIERQRVRIGQRQVGAVEPGERDLAPGQRACQGIGHLPADRDCPGAGFDRQRGAPAVDGCAKRDRAAVLGRIERGGGGVGDRPGVSLIVRGVDRRTGELDRPGGDRQRVQRGRGGADIAQDRRAGAGGDSQILRPAHRGQADFCTGRARIERGRAGEGEAGKRGILAKRQRALRRGRAKAVGRAALHLVGAGIERETAVGQREVCGAGDPVENGRAAARIDRQCVRSAGDRAHGNGLVASAGQRGIGAERDRPGVSLRRGGGDRAARDHAVARNRDRGQRGPAAHGLVEFGIAGHGQLVAAIERRIEGDRACQRRIGVERNRRIGQDLAPGAGGADRGAIERDLVRAGGHKPCHIVGRRAVVGGGNDHRPAVGRGRQRATGRHLEQRRNPAAGRHRAKHHVARRDFARYRQRRDRDRSAGLDQVAHRAARARGEIDIGRRDQHRRARPGGDVGQKAAGVGDLHRLADQQHRPRRGDRTIKRQDARPGRQFDRAARKLRRIGAGVIERRKHQAAAVERAVLADGDARGVDQPDVDRRAAVGGNDVAIDLRECAAGHPVEHGAGGNAAGIGDDPAAADAVGVPVQDRAVLDRDQLVGRIRGRDMDIADHAGRHRDNRGGAGQGRPGQRGGGQRHGGQPAGKRGARGQAMTKRAMERVGLARHGGEPHRDQNLRPKGTSCMVSESMKRSGERWTCVPVSSGGSSGWA